MKSNAKQMLSKKMSAYTAGAGAALAAAAPASAAIIYSGPLSTPFDPGTGVVFLTLEGDTWDFGLIGDNTYADTDALVAWGNSAANAVFGTNGPELKKLSANDSINAALFADSYYFGRISYINTTHAIDQGEWTQDGEIGFFGFRFELENASPNAAAGTPVYGWAEVERISPSAGRLLGWAYEDSGAEILAGAIPEPGALGLAALALGAAGLAALRQKKDA